MHNLGISVKRCWRLPKQISKLTIMKLLQLLLASLLPLFALADSLKISVQVLDRADDGSAIRGKFVYPVVELESGETGKLHIGREMRYPVWVQKAELGNGVSRDEILYEETPIGLLFSLKYVLQGGAITYTGRATSKVSGGTSGTSSGIKSSEMIFYGKTTIGELVQIQFEGADRTPEEILIYFGPSDE